MHVSLLGRNLGGLQTQEKGVRPAGQPGAFGCMDREGNRSHGTVRWNQTSPFKIQNCDIALPRVLRQILG